MKQRPCFFVIGLLVAVSTGARAEPKQPGEIRFMRGEPRCGD